MNLKAKLYILKNHAFLLLRPSPFEHWFKSYQIITIGSLHFCEIANQSSSSSSGSRAPADLRCPPLAHVSLCCLSHWLSLLTQNLPPWVYPSVGSRIKPDTARAASAGRPPLSHVGPPVPSGCHATEGHAGAARRPEPDLVTTLPLPLFYEAMRSYKARPKPNSSPISSSSSSRHRSSPRAPHRNSPRPLHPAQIPAAHRSLTSSASFPT
jgi:hypothetical protein